jgi:hypothetical protein
MTADPKDALTRVLSIGSDGLAAAFAYRRLPIAKARTSWDGP